MTISLAGKTAVVTGATRGIGRAIARALAEAGATVVICGRSQSDTERAVRELISDNRRLFGISADVTDNVAVARLFDYAEKQAGAVDILVNNAGVGIFRPVAQLTVEEWKSVIDTNLTGVFYCCREAIPRMMRRGGGSIFNISSLAGKNPFAAGAAYNASKFGLNGFSEAMMMDHRYDGIRVTYVMPGSVDTEFGGRGGATSWRIAPQDIAQIILDILAMPERTLISRVEVRPSKPAK